jgi:hypothetical protein
MKELGELQEELASQIFLIPFFNKEEKRAHLDLMKEFLEKQKNLLFRMSLSDDPEALETKKQILQSAKMLGLKDGQGINEFFDLLESTIDTLDRQINKE